MRFKSASPLLKLRLKLFYGFDAFFSKRGWTPAHRSVQSLLFQTPKEISETVFHPRDLVPHISKHCPSLIQ
jgi:hypothetical protein